MEVQLICFVVEDNHWRSPLHYVRLNLWFVVLHVGITSYNVTVHFSYTKNNTFTCTNLSFKKLVSDSTNTIKQFLAKGMLTSKNVIDIGKIKHNLRGVVILILLEHKTNPYSELVSILISWKGHSKTYFDGIWNNKWHFVSMFHVSYNNNITSIWCGISINNPSDLEHVSRNIVRIFFTL